MVPLLELVDRDLGLGPPETPADAHDDDPALDLLKMRMASEATLFRRDEVVLTDGDVERLFPHAHSAEANSSRDMSFHVAAASAEAIDRGEYRVVPGTIYTVLAGQSMGRFALALGSGFTARLRSATGPLDGVDESVELVYPPYGRLYNVSTRARVRGAELRIGIGEPGDDDGTQVYSPDDIWVGLENERFYLWSPSRKQRLGIAEGHLMVTMAHASPVCRFLSLLGYEGRAMSQSFPWGPAQLMRALPRVRYGRIVLAPRRWNFATSELGTSPEEAAAAIAGWRNEWQMPRYVLFVQGDNQLLLDLESPLAAELLRDQTGEASPILTLCEMLPAPGELWLQGPGGKHTVELVANLATVSSTPSEPRAPGRASPVIATERTLYGPGSDWTYVKLYMSRHAEDTFLARDLAGLMNPATLGAQVERWFFLRYRDLRTHIRLRVKSSRDAHNTRHFVVDAAERWLRAGLIERYALDTYDPEYERYGGAQELEAVERLWHEDSISSVQALATPIQNDAERVALAARTFNAFVFGSNRGTRLAIDAFQESARKGVRTDDRPALKELQRSSEGRQSSLDAALACADPEARLRNILHLHCNRLGIAGEAEGRVGALLRGAALSRQSRPATLQK